MSIFEQFMRGRQFAQQQALNQMRLAQAEQLFPIEQQLKNLQLERESQAIESGRMKQEAFSREEQDKQTVRVGRLAEQALSIEDEDARTTFIRGAAQEIGLGDEFDPNSVTEEQLTQLVGAKQAIEGSLKPSRLGRIFQAKDAQGKMVFAQADSQGNVKVVEGLTPSDIEQQRIDLQRDIATGNLEQEEKKLEAKTKVAKQKQQADMNALTNTISQVDSLINDPDFSGAVGLIDQFTARIGATVGTKEGIVNRRAKRLLNNSIVKIAKSLGANPTDRDMVILKETQPALNDQPSVWQDWYKNELIPTINARLKAFEQPEIEPMTPDAGKVRRLRYNPQTGQFE